MTGVYLAQDGAGGAYLAPESIANSGTTSVSSSLASAYFVRSAVSSSLAGAYVARTMVSAGLDSAYGVRQGAVSDLAGVYGIRAMASAGLDGAYAIRQGVGATLDGAYAVRGSTSAVVAEFNGAYLVAAPEHPYVRSVSRTYMVTDSESAAPIPAFRKAPGAKLDYSFDWSLYLAAVDDQLVSCTITAPPALTVSTRQQDGNSISVWVRGGVAGYKHTVVCEIETQQGRVDSRTILIELVTDR